MESLRKYVYNTQTYERFVVLILSYSLGIDKKGVPNLKQGYYITKVYLLNKFYSLCNKSFL